jgi:hypothetical protein
VVGAGLVDGAAVEGVAVALGAVVVGVGATVVRGAAEVAGGTVVDVVVVVELVVVVEPARSVRWAFTAAGPDEPQAASTTKGTVRPTTANEWARRLPLRACARSSLLRFFAVERESITEPRP